MTQIDKLHSTATITYWSPIASAIFILFYASIQFSGWAVSGERPGIWNEGPSLPPSH